MASITCQLMQTNLKMKYSQKTWQYISDHNPRKTRLIFKNNFCTAVSRKNIFYTYMKNMFTSLNNVLMLPCENET